MSEQDLHRFTKGTAKEVAAVVETYSPRLLALACSYLRNPDDAADCVQQTWVTAFERRATLQNGGAFGAWLTEICRNRCLNELRRRARWEDPRKEGSEFTVHPDYATSSTLLRVLTDAFATLPDRQREVVHLRLVDGRSTRETADALGCAEGTVKAALHAAVRKLRKELHAWKD